MQRAIRYFGSERVSVNFGCGEDKRQDAVNIDVRREVKPDIVWDLEQFPYPLPDDTFELAIWKDSLEHLSWRVVREALKETYRILKDNGLVYIQTPDLEAIAKKIVLNPEFRYGDIRQPEAIGFWVYGRQDSWGGVHKSGFTIPTLKKLLEEVGFEVEKIENDGGTNIICYARKL